MNLPADSLIAYTVEKMNLRLAERIPADDAGQLRSGLLYMGNVHDAYPRRLLLDTRLSPLDKMAWMMIRLYAQQNEGAIFPTYDELQLQLASPHKGKASRETISRVLLMLRITGWLSLCKRVRDEKGRVRGNIYAQHDEPLSFRDAEIFDPGWLDTVAEACQNKNKTISQTAWEVLNEIKNDTTMRHRHSRIALIESRLGSAQTPQQMAARQRVRYPSSESELRQKPPSSDINSLSSVSELSHPEEDKSLGSESELSGISRSCHSVRNPNRYVRSNTQCVKRNTYVLPSAFEQLLPMVDRSMVTEQLQALTSEQAEQVLQSISRALSDGGLTNPIGWLLSVLKRARDGKLFTQKTPTRPAQPQAADALFTEGMRVSEAATDVVPKPVSDKAFVQNMLAEIRKKCSPR
ncbi:MULTISPECIES: STY4528 family pathogenicity island replication protein [Pectobacterium]|uniref:Helix-turn-helix domain-containing protein n=1 Tax=Pectobacterium aquaticum TaxID=2204145 RepID=A0AA93AKF7_9GAMM|nr:MULTISPECIES: STY4528 family pathogenicity island replication protein [Pectobacterium]MCH5051926.1 helix-turn-helix domain-containing protein [Pectobacterium aquaticum]QHP79330.1 helix-turn-helix domain-containing protein [Pectobacterium odoriferum]RRO04087.1 helix-turn-helix domain-containing protein [Pectobacterium aquaticum]RRO13310.1 helix-turn-helix domain-containing protein [Pectobacterium aquaticum]